MQEEAGAAGAAAVAGQGQEWSSEGGGMHAGHEADEVILWNGKRMVRGCG